LIRRLLGTGDPASTGRFFSDRPILGLVALSFVLQILYVIFANAPTDIGDQLVYRDIGEHFKRYWEDGGYYGPILRTPGYGAYLALHYELGLGEWAVHVTQALALSLTCGAVAYMATRKAGLAAGRVSAALFCLYVPLMSFSSMILTEAVSICLATLGTAICIAAGQGDSRRRLVVLGVAMLVLALITRPNAVTVALPTLLYLVVSSPSYREAATRVGIAALLFAVLFGPWIARNIDLFSRPMVLGDAGPYALALGTHLPVDRETGQFGSHERSSRFFSDTRADGFSARDAGSVKPWKELRENLSDHTGEFLESRAFLQYQMWFWPITARTQYGRDDPVPYGFIMAFHLFILATGIAGLLLTRRQATSRLFGVVLAVTPLPYLVYYPEPRYTLSVMPFLIVGAACALVPVARRLAATNGRRHSELPAQSRVAAKLGRLPK